MLETMITPPLRTCGIASTCAIIILMSYSPSERGIETE
jgi:hypothetical protein